MKNSAAVPSGAAEKRRFKEFIRGSDRKSTRLNSSHITISYAVFCLKKKKNRLLSLAVSPWYVAGWVPECELAPRGKESSVAWPGRRVFAYTEWLCSRSWAASFLAVP